MTLLLQKRASEKDEQLKKLRNQWDSERAALQLEVATGKEHAKVCCLHTVVYHPFNTHDINNVWHMYCMQAVSRDVHHAFISLIIVEGCPV